MDAKLTKDGLFIFKERRIEFDSVEEMEAYLKGKKKNITSNPNIKNITHEVKLIE